MSFRLRELTVRLSGDDPKDPKGPGDAIGTQPITPNCGCGATGRNVTDGCPTDDGPKPRVTPGGHLAELRQQLRETVAGPQV